MVGGGGGGEKEGQGGGQVCCVCVFEWCVCVCKRERFSIQACVVSDFQTSNEQCVVWPCTLCGLPSAASGTVCLCIAGTVVSGSHLSLWHVLQPIAVCLAHGMYWHTQIQRLPLCRWQGGKAFFFFWGGGGFGGGGC